MTSPIPWAPRPCHAREYSHYADRRELGSLGRYAAPRSTRLPWPPRLTSTRYPLVETASLLFDGDAGESRTHSPRDSRFLTSRRRYDLGSKTYEFYTVFAVVLVGGDIIRNDRILHSSKEDRTEADLVDSDTHSFSS